MLSRALIRPRSLASSSCPIHSMISLLGLWRDLKRQISILAMKTAPEKNPEEEVQQQPDLNARDDYFRFTRGRFVCNEAFEMAQRYIRFDMNALSKIAANAVGSDFCVAVEKYPDGMYNKTFLFTTNDGSQVVGKVPNPNAGKPHFTTASEVATMDFVCCPVTP